MPVRKKPAAAVARAPCIHVCELEEVLIGQWIADCMEAKGVAALLRWFTSALARASAYHARLSANDAGPSPRCVLRTLMPMRVCVCMCVRV